MYDIQAIREAFLPIREMLPIKADRRDIYTAEKIYDVDGDPEPYVMFVCSPATDVWKNAIVLSINNIEALVERLTASEARAKAAEERVSALNALATLGLEAAHCWPVGDFDGGDIQDEMERLGLIKKSDEPYNRDKHGDIGECYEGEEFYLYTEIYYAATKALKGAPNER